MEGRAGQCQLVSRIKTTHLFAEVSRKATGPKWGEAVEREEGRDRAILEMREGPLFSGPCPSLPLYSYCSLVSGVFFVFFCCFFLPVTYLSGAARSHYRGVRKAVGRVASPGARVTDCCSALVVEEARSV